MIRAVLLGFRLCFMAMTKMKLNGKITGGYTSQRMQDDLDAVFPDRKSALNFDQAQWIKILTLSNELNVTTSNVIRLAIRRSIMTERPDRPFNKTLLVTEAERRALRSEANSRNMCVNSFVRKAITEL